MPTRRKTRRQALSEFRNSEILEAARRVFAARGFEGAAVEEIASLAGLAKGTLYLYYPSKRAIYHAALKRGLVDLLRELDERVNAASSPREKLRTFVDTKIAYFEEHRDFFRIYYTELGRVVAHPLYYEKDLRQLYLCQLRILRSVLREIVEPETAVEVAAFAVYDLMRGAITRRLVGRSRQRTEADVAFLTELVWKGVSTR